MIHEQKSILGLVSLAILMGFVSVEAKLIPQRKRPVQRPTQSQAQKRVDPKIGCGATGGASKVPMLAAAYYGDIATLEKLLASGTDINLRDSYGRTALLVATNHAHTAVVKFLLEKGADANVNAGGHTPLMYAACLSDVESVKALLEKGADVNANDSVALVWIRGTYDTESKESEQIFRLFLAKGVKVPAQAIIAAASGNDVRKMNELLSRNADTKAKNSEGNTALQVAAEYGSPEIAQALLAKGAAINEKNNDGMTPLMIAVEERRLAMVEVLLSNGADVTVKDSAGETALDYAEDNDDKTIIELLTQAKSGRKANTVYAADDIFSLVRKRDLPKLQELLKKNATAVNAKDAAGVTPLHHAARQNSPEMIRLFLANKAEVNARDKDSMTPLHYAAHGTSVSPDSIKVLLESGADPNANNGTDTPFHYAIVFGQVEAVKLMLEYKANVTIKNRGQTPLQLAGRKAEIIKLLRAYGAK